MEFPINTNLNQAVWKSWQPVTAIKNAIITNTKDLATQEPILLKFWQILSWAVNHPIISVVIFLFAIAFIWSIIKGIVRLIETASWSILKVPLKLLQFLLKSAIISLTKFVKRQPKITNQKNDHIFTVTNVDTIICEDRKQQLLEISRRLELINKEQQQLLQEAANLIDSDSNEMTITDVK